jgi:GT2 family glycosyltransferase
VIVNDPETTDVTVIIPTFRRSAALTTTLDRLAQCLPRPGQIIVHVDAGDDDTGEILQSRFPAICCIQSETQQGPGGGRNKLMAAALHEIVVSLDDDSWPIDSDFFVRVHKVADDNPRCGAIACRIVEADRSESFSEGINDPAGVIVPGISFVGCGAVLRKSAFATTSGYLPLRYAYGMEEADVSLQLLNNGYEICFCPQLTVFHDCDRDTHHANARINSAQITNTALLGFLRYPLRYFPYACLQVVSRIVFSLKKRRYSGILSGVVSIPFACLRNRRHRKSVAVKTLATIRRLKQSVR